MKDEKKNQEQTKEYLPFVPFFSVPGTHYDESPVHRLFDDTPEQISHGTAPWDEYGWSRDGWCFF